MLDPIEDEVEARRGTAALGIEFPVVFDREADWRRAAIQARQPDPFMMIYKGGVQLGVISPRAVRAVRTYLPAAMLLGRDP